MAGIQNNRYYNDPALGQAFSNLSGLFGPPSASDTLAYASAKAKKEEAGRLAELFNLAKDPNVQQAVFDRLGQATGQWTPSTGYYGVDTTAATARRGQDIGAATELQKQRIADEGALARLYATPQTINKDQTLVLPEGTAGAMGLPRMMFGQTGAAQGETIFRPDGTVLKGEAKPLSETEIKGAERQRLAQSGLLTDQMLVDNIVGSETPVEAVGADGKPIYKSPGAAVREGAQPFVKPTADSQTELTRLMQERDALPEGDPRRAAYDARIAALGRGQQQSAYDKQVDEDLAKLNAEIFNNATKAAADRGTYAALEAAVNNPNVTQGALGTASLALKKTLNSFGLNAGDTGPAEMLNALGNQISLRLRDPSSGAGMPGAMSDADRVFLQSMAVSLGNSPTANQLLARYYMAAQERAVALNDLRQQYITKNGRLDEGFRAQVGDYLANSDPTKAVRERIAGLVPNAANPEDQRGQSGVPGGGQTADPVDVATPEEARQLPSGTPIRLPDGSIGRVP